MNEEIFIRRKENLKQFLEKKLKDSYNLSLEKVLEW